MPDELDQDLPKGKKAKTEDHNLEMEMVVASTMTVRDLKILHAQTQRVPVDSVVVLVRGQLLEDMEQLHVYTSSTLEVYVLTPGGTGRWHAGVCLRTLAECRDLMTIFTLRIEVY